MSLGCPNSWPKSLKPPAVVPVCMCRDKELVSDVGGMPMLSVLMAFHTSGPGPNILC